MKRTVVPMGPQHPVLPEPLVLDLILEDERVVDAVPTIGYIHRGLEAMVERVEYTEMGFVVERICGICSFQHGMGYCLALERIMGVEVPDRARWLRLVWAELARIQSHLLWLGLGADAFGFEHLFMHCWRMRERLLDIFEATTGGRIIHSVNRIGGVKRDIADPELAAIVASLRELGEGFAETARVFRTDPSIHHRLARVGVLPAADAHALGAVGPMARASGIRLDTRLDAGADSGGLYEALGFEPVVEQDGDCLARVLVRVREVEQSIELVRRAVERMPKGEGLPIETKVRGVPDGETFLRLEQPRGEVVYFVRANGSRFLERLRVRTPTFANIPAMIRLVKGCDLADVPNIVLTIDPCISCTER
ncbi:MAG TPA: nickel-dependent hydrogenase large subunit [Candidatus Limnocylindrales bacterium]